MKPKNPPTAAPGAPLSLENAVPGGNPYLVMQDAQGRAYLRVAESLFITLTGKRVELVKMDAATVRSRSFQSFPEASVIDAAKIFAKPLTAEVIVGDRARKYLDVILNDKELIEMAKAKKARKTSAKAAASNGAASKKVARKRANGEEKIVKNFSENPYREGSARAELLNLAVKSGTVEKYFAAAGKPKGGSASAYLSVFRKDGVVKVVAA